MNSQENILTPDDIDQLLNSTIPSFQLTSPSTRNLGFGHIFYGFARALRPAHTVIIGSKAGFAPIVYGLAVKHNRGFGIKSIDCEEVELESENTGSVHFVDPSYSLHRDDPNHSYGLGKWDDPIITAQIWQRFGIEDVVKHFKITSAEYRKNHCRENAIDLLYVDGDHSFSGIRDDLIGFLPFLKDNAVVLAHDVDPNCRTSQGFQVLQSLDAHLYEYVRIPIYPGLAIMRKR